MMMESTSCEAVYNTNEAGDGDIMMEDVEDARGQDFHSLPPEWPPQYSQESLISPRDYPDPEPDLEPDPITISQHRARHPKVRDNILE